MTTDFCLLHIGDLHIAEKDVWSSGEGMDLLVRIVDAASSRPPNVIVCTGDVGDRGHDRSIKRGFEWLRQIRKQIERKIKEPIPIVVVPGNHDTAWPDGWSKLRTWDPRKRTQSFRRHVELLENYTMYPPLTPHQRKRALSALAVGSNGKWFYWIPSSTGGIFILPLSSVEYGAGLHKLTKQSEKIRDMRTSISRFRRKRTSLNDDSQSLTQVMSNLDKVTLDDMPYIDDDFLEGLRELPGKWNTDWQEKFSKALKIAVIHHPLLPVAGEQELRAFDVVANGAAAFNTLAGLGFHLVLYGHKHVFGTRVLRGSDVETDDAFLEDKGELLGVVGGLVGSRYETPHRGFQFIEVKANLSNGAWRDVVLTRFLRRRQPPHKLPESHQLCTVDSSGHLLWVPAFGNGGYNKRVLSRGCTAISRLEEAIAAFGRSPQMLAPHRGDVMQAVESALDELIEFAKEGSRGVDRTFENDICRSAEEGDCLAFVDYGGRSTWYHEDLLGFLARLSSIYQKRNSATRDLRFSQFILDKLTELKYQTFFGPYSEGTSTVGLSLVRILVWEERYLTTAPAKSLIRFHDIFKIPLFWCDPKSLQGILAHVYNDFHLEWSANGCSNGCSNIGREPRPINQNDLPDRVWYYDTQGRAEISASDRELYWKAFLGLLDKSTPLLPQNASSLTDERA